MLCIACMHMYLLILFKLDVYASDPACTPPSPNFCTAPSVDTLYNRDAAHEARNNPAKADNCVCIG